mgnify:CR=1 FL=1
MLMLTLLLIAAACFVAFRNWRWGIGAAILVGLLQDALRKMIPGTPSYLAMASAPVWLATILSAAYAGQLSPQRFFNTFPRLALWVQVFGLYLLVPAAISASYGQGTWQITLLGAFVYLTVFMVMVVGWRYPDSEKDLGRLLAFYVVAASLMLLGGPLEAWGYHSRFPVIGTEALGHVWVTYRTGAPVYMRAGFFRGPDIMGWHAALVFMVAVVMAFRSKGLARWSWIVVGVWGVLNIWLCGRRKMLSMVPIFLGAYLLLIFRFKNFRRFFTVTATVVLMLGLGWYFISSFYHDEAVEAFYLTTLTEAESRVETHGYRTVLSTIHQAGFWGYGLGMSQQGVHNIAAEKPRLYQEGGPGKLLAELGIPGAVLFLALGAVLFITAYQLIRRERREESFYISAGILSLLLANLASAVVSAQIFGDPLVAFLLAILTGLMLSGGRPMAAAPGSAPAGGLEAVPRNVLESKPTRRNTAP